MVTKNKKASVKARPIIKKPIIKKRISKKEYNKLFANTLIEISEDGKSVIAALKGKMSTQKFYELLEDEGNAKRYARACEMRAEVIANETIEIADSKRLDVNRDKLRVDTRKWLLAKLHPKKYGEKIDMTSDGKPFNPSVKIEIINNKDQVKPDDTNS
jgi:hypothetical protein